LLDKEKDILGSLEVGQAVVKLQGRIAHPFQVSIPEFVIEKGKITDTYVKKHMQGIAPAFPEEDFRLPPHADIARPENSAPEPKTKSMNSVEIEFLKDVQEYPDSGIAARYKRLGLSVRQGQKVKVRLLEQGLIEENEEMTRTGRLKAINLTKKGEALLSKAE
jgi:predicted transcriptional regulator